MTSWYLMIITIQTPL